MKLSERMISRATTVSENCAVWLEEYGRLVALLEAKLTAIECGDCAKTMLECKCDD